MNLKSLFAVVGAVAFVVPAIAQEASPAASPTIARRTMIYSADGSRVAPVERVVEGADGAPVAVKLIFNSKLLTIPASTLSAFEKGLKTSLTRVELKRM